MKKKKLKGLLSAILSAVMIFGMTSCSNNNADNSSSQNVSNIIVEGSGSNESKDDNVSNNNIDNSSSNPSSSTESEITEIDNSITPVMWKVETDDGQNFYLLGSFHAGDYNVKSMPKVYTDAMASCDYLAVECDTDAMMSDSNNMLDLTMRYIYSDGSQLKDHISEETYNLLVDYLESYSSEYTMISSVLDYMTAEYWAIYVETPIISLVNLSTDLGIDSQLIKWAKSEGKTVLSVENYEDSLNALSGYSDLFYELQILSTVADKDGIEGLKKDILDMYNAWKSGSNELLEMLDEDEGEEDTDELSIDISDELMAKFEAQEDSLEKEADLYEKKMITDRNIVMANAAEQYIKDGKSVFFVVGAAHMYEEDGIIEILRSKGYTVTQICGEAV